MILEILKGKNKDTFLIFVLVSILKSKNLNLDLRPAVISINFFPVQKYLIFFYGGPWNEAPGGLWFYKNVIGYKWSFHILTVVIFVFVIKHVRKSNKID